LGWCKLYGTTIQSAKLHDPISPRVWKAINADLDGIQTEITGAEGGMAYAVNPESSVVFRQMVFLKFGITYRGLITEVDLENSARAYAKLQKVHLEMFRLKSGMSHRDLKLKFNYDHFFLMVQGLDLGLNKLNPRELAACFDELCPCDRRHSVEYIRKFRTRVRKAVKTLLSDETKTYMPIS